MNLKLSSVTTPLRSLWDDLVEHRLWPVAIALVIALVAAPLLLSKSAKHASPPSPAPAATGSGSPAIAFQPAVSTEGKKSSEIRKDLKAFAKKNPFTPQGLSAGAGSADVTAAAGAAVPTAVSTTSSASPGGTSGGGSTPSGSTTGGGSTGSSGTGKTTKTFYYHYTVDVRFGKTGNEDNKTLTEFRPLPSTVDPILVFMGVKNDGKTAVFLVSAKATTIGDGKCSPSDTECTFLYMKKGDKQTIEAVGVSGAVIDYTLKLRSIDVKRTDSPPKAKSSKSKRNAARRKSRARHRTVVKTFRTLGL